MPLLYYVKCFGLFDHHWAIYIITVYHTFSCLFYSAYFCFDVILFYIGPVAVFSSLNAVAWAVAVVSTFN
jgi:hypothetical protein